MFPLLLFSFSFYSSTVLDRRQKYLNFSREIIYPAIFTVSRVFFLFARIHIALTSSHCVPLLPSFSRIQLTIDQFLVLFHRILT
ncbi:hypothetical protein B9Z19DRAFT_1081842 [Tuber borchii]|uniref:Uncharacterized protein n=1 Tax=Tuber borchii TaxID=42251 RepID=A0A2T6ZV76_TUBBO|nr:hypothetical protein B9Z19DRAFT_1081842 [Tuber borchii]